MKKDPGIFEPKKKRIGSLLINEIAKIAEIGD